MDTLQDNLPALITAEGKPAINRWLDYDPGEAWKNDAPIVWVDVGAEEAIQLQAAGGVQDRTWRIVVGVTATGANASAAANSLRTYHDLVLRVFELHPELGGELSGGLLSGSAEVIDVEDAVFTRNLAISGGLLQEVTRSYRIVMETVRGEA
jgi:hypothetical protein